MWGIDGLGNEMNLGSETSGFYDSEYEYDYPL
jgi:hypothetical protein